jgi:glycosyltransferase involved in cell wall biosynthesis
MRNPPIRLCVYSETQAIGGSETVLADIARDLDPELYSVHFAGNDHPELEDWLSARAGRRLRRDTLPVATVAHDPVRAAGRLFPARLKQVRPQAQASANWMTPVEPDAVEAVRAAARYARLVWNLRVLRGYFARTKPDVVHINNGGYPGAESCRVVSMAAKASGIGVVNFVHQYAAGVGFWEPLERRLDRRVDAATDVWVTAAQGSSDRLAGARRIERERIRTVYLGQPELQLPTAEERASVRHEIGIADGAVALAIVGRLEPRKGQSQAIQALAQVREAGSECELVLIGEGPQRAELEALSSDLGLSGHVHFLGFVNEPVRLLQGCDVIAAPSPDPELLPYALKEGMAIALPAVATDVGGIPELVVDGVTGSLVPPHDVSALARGIRALADDSDLRQRMGLAGRERVRTEFATQKMVSELAGLYEMCAARSQV